MKFGAFLKMLAFFPWIITPKIIKIQKKDSTKIPSKANYQSFDIFFVKVTAFLLPENLFPEKLYRKKSIDLAVKSRRLWVGHCKVVN